MKSPSSRFDVALAAYPMNYLKGLRERQIPFRKPLQNSLLSYFVLNDHNRYLPVHVLCSFFKEIRKHYGLEFYGQQYLTYLKLINMGVNGKFIVSNNRVLPTLQLFAKYGDFLCTNQDIQLHIKGTTVSCSNQFYGEASIEKNIMEYVWLNMLLDVLRNAEDPLWGPLQMHFTGKESEYPQLEMIPQTTKICFNQEFARMQFKTSTLAKKFSTGIVPEVTEDMLIPPGTSLSEKIEQQFDRMYAKKLPSLKTTAEFFGVSVSTLKRHLGTEQLTYNEILERWRFMKGVNLLTETNLKIMEISESLHYANTANFSRAFRRWSGKTPKEFRAAS